MAAFCAGSLLRARGAGSAAFQSDKVCRAALRSHAGKCRWAATGQCPSTPAAQKQPSSRLAAGAALPLHSAPYSSTMMPSAGNPAATGKLLVISRVRLPFKPGVPVGCGLMKSNVLEPLQAGEHSSLRERIADLESMLSATQQRCADQAAELAVARRDHRSLECTSSSGADRLACLEGDAAALAQCSLGQLYRSNMPPAPSPISSVRCATLYSEACLSWAFLPAPACHGPEAMHRVVHQNTLRLVAVCPQAGERHWQVLAERAGSAGGQGGLRLEAAGGRAGREGARCRGGHHLLPLHGSPQGGRVWLWPPGLCRVLCCSL